MTVGTLLRVVSGCALLAGAIACNDNNNGTSPTSVPSATPSPTTTTASVVVTINGMKGNQSFSPNPAVVKAGQTIAWKNGDTIAHTATADNASFDTGSIAPGATSKTITMPAAGTMGYHCSIHPTMVGTVTVQ